MHVLLVKTSSLGDVIHNLPVAADIEDEELLRRMRLGS